MKKKKKHISRRSIYLVAHVENRGREETAFFHLHTRIAPALMDVNRWPQNALAFSCPFVACFVAPGIMTQS